MCGVLAYAIKAFDGRRALGPKSTDASRINAKNKEAMTKPDAHAKTHGEVGGGWDGLGRGRIALFAGNSTTFEQSINVR